MGTPNTEQKTVINFSRTGNEATVTTTDEEVITKLNALCESEPGVYEMSKKGNADKEAHIFLVHDKNAIEFLTSPE